MSDSTVIATDLPMSTATTVVVEDTQVVKTKGKKKSDTGSKSAKPRSTKPKSTNAPPVDQQQSGEEASKPKRTTKPRVIKPKLAEGQATSAEASQNAPKKSVKRKQPEPSTTQETKEKETNSTAVEEAKVPSDSESPSSKGSSKKTGVKKELSERERLLKDEGIKRPKSAYFYFLDEYRTSNPGFKVPELAKAAGAAWKDQTLDKSKYEEQHRLAVEMHKQQTETFYQKYPHLKPIETHKKRKIESGAAALVETKA